MRYYLSYIEVDGEHAGFMLSTQETPLSPIEIVKEYGYGGHWGDAGLFQRAIKRFDGVVSKEANASRVLYGHSTLKHVTYEITETEACKFLEIMERDVQDFGANMPRSYQYLMHNCKNYAMDVFKEIGITDANLLSNFFIQRPGSKESLLHPIGKEDLRCPLEDEFLSRLKPQLANIKTILKACCLLLNAPKYRDTVKILEGLLITVDYLKSNQHKAGFSDEYKKEFDYLVFSLNGWLPILPEPLELSTTLNSQLIKTAREFTLLKNLLGTKGFPGSFYLTKPPILANRVDLSNFSEDEKEQYLLQAKQTDLSNGLEYLIKMLESKQNSSNNNDSKEDYKNFINVIKSHQAIVNKNIEEFHASLEGEDKNVKKLCEKHNKFINDHLDKLLKEINKYSPKSKKSMSPIKKFIINLLSFLKKDYFVVGYNAKQKLTENISSIKQSSDKKYYKNRTRAGLVFEAEPKIKKSDVEKPLLLESENKKKI